jgi:hypothetical protein
MAKVKKAQLGDTLKKKETSKGTTYKYKSDDGNYTTKVKYRSGEEPTEENPQFRGKIKQRRTLKGFLSGAPKPSMRKGGKVSKARTGKNIVKKTAMSVKKKK